jgi:hypothetical protein
MRKAMLFVLALGLALPAWASLPVLSLEGSQAIYAGGTLTQLKAGDAGSLDLTGPTSIRFVRTSDVIEIPYAQIDSWSQRKENAIPLGVAPMIAVGLIAQRHKLHFIQITYRDSAGVSQVAVFQIAKTMPPIIEPVLKVRVTHDAPHSLAPRPTVPATTLLTLPAQNLPASSVVQ